MFNPMHNGWAEQDAAHEALIDRAETRDALREEYATDIESELLYIGKQWSLRAIERQAQDEAMEAIIDAIFKNPEKQAIFERALIEIWARYCDKDDSPMRRLANIIGYGVASFANQKAREKFQ